jgi:hypothetical protein
MIEQFAWNKSSLSLKIILQNTQALQLLKQKIFTKYGNKTILPVQSSIFHFGQTRLTLVDKSWLFIKPFIFIKNRLSAFHSFTTKKVVLLVHENMRESA